MVRRMLKVAACVGAVLASGQAMANNHDHGMPFKIGAQLRTEWKHSDNKIDAGDDATTNDWELVALKLKMSGNLSANTSFNFLVNNTPYVTIPPVGTTVKNTSFVELGYVTHKVNDMMSIRVGRDYANYGGFERKDQNFDAMYNSPFISTADPMGHMVDGFALMFNWGDAANVTVQAFDDMNNDSQPAVTAEWTGNFGMVSALAQLASYYEDGVASSMAYGIGLKMTSGAFEGCIDYGMNQRAVTKDDNNDEMRLGLHVQYDTGAFVPFAKFTMWDVTQPGTDSDDNSGATVASADDNLTQWTIGSHWRMDGNVFRPYLAIVNHSGDFAGTDEDSQMDIKLGVMSDF